MDGVGDLEVSGLRLSLEPSGTGKGIRPVIHGGDVTIPNAGFTKIVHHFLGDEITLPQVRLTFVSCRLIDGGAEVVVRAKRGLLDQNVRVELELTPAGTGDLRVTIAGMRVGRLSANWLLDFVLGAVDRVEGLKKAGAKSIDIDLSALLASRDVPVDIATGVSAVNASSTALNIRF
jgi:hypothetical protein